MAGGSLRERKKMFFFLFSLRALQINAAAQIFIFYGECGTYSRAVVDFLSHILADVLQLCLCDVLHRPHYMRDGLGTVERTATGL